LLEAVVFAHRAFEHALPKLQALSATTVTKTRTITTGPLPEWDAGQAVQIEEQIDIAANWLEIRHLMWNYVGIVRSNRRLERAQRRLRILQAEVTTYYWDFLLTRDLIELRNLLTVSELIVECAIRRKESRGLHFTVDYPNSGDVRDLKDTVLD